jgi:hypothetical protein
VAKKVDLKAKAKRQKIVAGVLGVILLGVLGFEGPKTLKQLTGPKVDPLRVAAASSTTSTGTVPLAPPTLGGSTPSSSADLASSSVPAGTSIDQLTSFSRFASKDPFLQQVTPNGSTSNGSSGSALGGGSTSGGSTVPSPSPSPTTPTVPKTKPPVPTAAVISVNGDPAQLIQVGQDFPLAPYDPIFHLTSLGQGVAKIAIAGGSYTSGAPTVTLKKGKPLTLENTADGTRYALELLWTGAGQPPASLLPPPQGTATTTPATATTTTRSSPSTTISTSTTTTTTTR